MCLTVTPSDTSITDTYTWQIHPSIVMGDPMMTELIEDGDIRTVHHGEGGVWVTKLFLVAHWVRVQSLPGMWYGGV